MLLMFSVAVFQHYTMGYKKLQKGDNFFKWQKSLYQINRKKKKGDNFFKIKKRLKKKNRKKKKEIC